MRLVVGCRRKHDDDDDEKEEECFVFALWCCLFCIRLVWVKWKNKRKKQLSEYQRQCHVFLTNESLVRQEKSPHAQKTSRYVGDVKSFFSLVPILLLLQSYMRVYM